LHNCLRNDHFAANCKFGSCRECGERHNTLCHKPREPISSTKISRRESENNSIKTSRIAETQREASVIASRNSNSSVHHALGETMRRRVLMSTAIVNVKGGNSYDCQLRVLLDSASESNFITLTACKKLSLNLDNVCESVNSLSNMNCTSTVDNYRYNHDSQSLS